MQPLLVLASTFTLIIVTCYSSLLSNELYWNLMLPNTTMPKAIHDRLIPGLVAEDWGANKIHPDICFFYVFIPICVYSSMEAKDDNPMRNLFFKENDLNFGNKKSFYLFQSSNQANFLPHKIDDLDFLTSKNITTTLNLVLSQPQSLESKDMRNTINICQIPSQIGEDSLCATSLEAMIDFITSTLGKNVDVLVSEDVVNQDVNKSRSYDIITRLNYRKHRKLVVCHKLTYPYAVYSCHSIFDTRVYEVSLANEDGRKMNVVGVCHLDTSRWSPKHLAFKFLNVKPGSIPICHLVPGDHIVWVPK